MAEEKKKYDYRIVGNAWKKESVQGKLFLSLNMKETVEKDTAMFMFPNDHKRPDKKDPDWVISIKNEEGYVPPTDDIPF